MLMIHEILTNLFKIFQKEYLISKLNSGSNVFRDFVLIILTFNNIPFNNIIANFASCVITNNLSTLFKAIHRNIVAGTLRRFRKSSYLN